MGVRSEETILYAQQSNHLWLVCVSLLSQTLPAVGVVPVNVVNRQ